jgi:quercetin dioxygenase-like cupin family protein
MRPMRAPALAALLLIACASSPAPHAGAYSASTHVQTRLEAATTSADQPIAYPTGAPRVTMLEVVIDAGSETGWHQHPVHGFGYVLSGTLEVQTEHGATHRFQAGQAFAEVVNLPHNGRAVGTEPVRLVVVFTGVQGQPITTKLAAPPVGSQPPPR